MQKLAIMVLGETQKLADKFADAIRDFVPSKVLAPRPGYSQVSFVIGAASDLNDILSNRELRMEPEFARAESRLIVGVGESANATIDQLEDGLQAAQAAGSIQATEMYWPRIIRMSDALIRHCQQINLKTVTLMPTASEFFGESLAEHRVQAAGLRFYELEGQPRQVLRSLAAQANFQILKTGQANLAHQFRQVADTLVAPHAQVLAFDGMFGDMLEALKGSNNHLPVLIDLQTLYLEMIRDWLMEQIEREIARDEACGNSADIGAPPPHC